MECSLEHGWGYIFMFYIFSHCWDIAASWDEGLFGDCREGLLGIGLSQGEEKVDSQS